jgi:hypothetical protein
MLTHCVDRVILAYARHSQSGLGGRGDPRVVAEAIYEAVRSDQPKLRYLVGESAKMIGGLRRQLDDEQFEQTMRKALDIWD